MILFQLNAFDRQQQQHCRRQLRHRRDRRHRRRRRDRRHRRRRHRHWHRLRHELIFVIVRIIVAIIVIIVFIIETPFWFCEMQLLPELRETYQVVEKGMQYPEEPVSGLLLQSMHHRRMPLLFVF